MSKNEEKIVWRMVAVVDGDIISKDHKKAEKAIKQTRNAVVKRLCINAKIDYPYAWWQGPEAADKIEFADKFLGTLISVISGSKVRAHDHELEFIRYRVPQIVAIFGPKPTDMTADDIDSQGNWHFGEGDHEKMPLLGSILPVPSDVRSKDQPTKQEVIAMADAQLSLDNCPGCNADIPFGSIILITEFAHLFPANCCGDLIWFDKIAEAEFEGLE
jgi:hypothetical protein